jgi:hypothetical protein
MIQISSEWKGGEMKERKGLLKMMMIWIGGKLINNIMVNNFFVYKS